ncbi:restriction endonuclease subunit S [Deinococcus sp. JMULE3]|uniref:restriction endonuclease subunit S n=1 Tax=Deinococcus sp. JMULE3 TaxID=2518341 RepID=UPI0015771EAE
MNAININTLQPVDSEIQTDGLPPSWRETTLGEICSRIVDGSHNPPKAQPEGLPMLSAKNIQGRRITFDNPRLILADDFAFEDLRTSVSSGDVLMTIVGAIGRTAVVPENHSPFTLQRSVAVLKNPHIDSNLLAYFLEAPMLQNYFADNAKGTAQKGIYLKALSQTPIPLPPLPEQVRIADKLDALLARVEAGRERLERVPKLLKRFRQSVLSAAVSGELTREWRGGGDAEWEASRFGDFIREITQGWSPTCDKDPAPLDKWGVIKTTAIQAMEYRDQENKNLPDEFLPMPHLEIESGDLLITRKGPRVRAGVACYVRITRSKLMICDTVYRVRLSGKMSGQYAEIYLNAPETQGVIDELKAGISESGLNLTHSSIHGLSLNCPPPTEQAEIVRRVEALFAIADRIEAKYAAALSSFDRLTPALLAKAFRGELVPQDPNDEPASVLLERIRAARAAEGGKRGRGRPAKAAAGSEDGEGVKRRGRPPGANAPAGAEGAEPKRRGRPPKVREAVSEPAGQPAAVPEAVEASAAPRGRGRPPGPGIPQASSFEDALRKLEEQKLARAQGARQVGLFDDAE